MRILLDTNILIHREASKVLNEDIGILFNWFDKLRYEKCIHPLSLAEIDKHQDPVVIKTIKTKIQNYNLLKTEAPEVEEIKRVRVKFDKDENDSIDTSLLKEVFAGRVNYLISEDRGIHRKADSLGITDKVYTIDNFLEKVTAENPSLSDYKVLSVKKEFFGNINIEDSFFDSFKEDYVGFEEWFAGKSDEIAYVCQSEKGDILAFLYVKIEDNREQYANIQPTFSPKHRLKIGTFKVISNGHKLGERFLKVVFDNALINKVDEIYVTLFNKSDEQERLIGLLIDWGFEEYGKKVTTSGAEKVYIKNFLPQFDRENPKKTYPFLSKSSRFFMTPIYPEYHTELFPDSILNTESTTDYVENAPHRNAIQKIYISRSYKRELLAGDVILFYRAASKDEGPGYYKSVISTIGIVENVIDNILNEQTFIELCRKRSIFSDSGLSKFWNWSPRNRPFIVNFLYVYSFPKRLILKELIELGVIRGIKDAPRGFTRISKENFIKIIEGSNTDESFIVD